MKPVKCYIDSPEAPGGTILNIELGIYLFSHSDVARMEQLFMKVYIHRDDCVWPFSAMFYRKSRAIKKGFPFLL